MELSGVEAVLEFLRRNGLSQAESALMEDVIEKSQLASLDFHKFIFPMDPPPPTLKIPTNRISRRRSDDCFSVSSDEFVSLGSSSSEFTNPYGDRQTSGATSESSSDHLSEFGTARDYPDFDLQNNLWYEEIEEIREAEEHYSMPPIFGSSGSFSGPTEDKFVTTTTPETEIQSESAFMRIKTNIFDKIHVENGKIHVTDYHLKTEETLNQTIVDHRTEQNRSTISPNKRNPIYEPMKLNNDEVDTTANDELATYVSNDDEHEVFNLRIIHRKNRTGFEENKDLEIVMNSMIAARYYVTEYLGSAAFSKVVQARDLYTGSDVCLKIIKNDKDFFDQSLDEIKLLKFVNKYDPADQRHILRLYDYFYFQEHLFIVCELLRANLYEFQKYNRESGGEPYFTLNRLQVITRQCLEALEYLHNLGIIHCDLKPENILIKSYRRCEIKVIDLGSSCFQTDNLCLYVQSRSYRAPEVILGLQYDEKIDIWSLGCILAELCSGEVLFPNDGIVMSLARMVGFLGPIDMEMLVNGQETHKYFTKEFDIYQINEETNEMEYIIPAESSLEEQLEEGGGDIGFSDFVRHLLEINPKNRPTATTALLHPWLSHSYT